MRAVVSRLSLVVGFGGACLTKRFLVSVLLLAVTASSAQQVDKKRNNETHAGGSRHLLRLSLAIRADQHVYEMADVVPLSTQFTNIGEGILYLFDDVCWNPGNFLTIHVFTMGGKDVSGKSDFLRDCLPPPPSQNDTTRFLKLDPDSFYGVIETFSVRELVPGPGEYDIVVYFEAALSSDWIRKYGGDKIATLPIWTRDQPLLTSNRLRIIVKP
jgi:hypothetical protein